MNDLNKEYKIIIRFLIVIIIAAFFSDILMYSLYNLLFLANASGLHITLSSTSWTNYTIFFIILIVTYYVIISDKSFLLVAYIILYILTSSYLNSLNLTLTVLSLALYFMLEYLIILGSDIKLSANMKKRGIPGAVLLVILFWIIYRFFVFTASEIKNFVYEWISRSTIEIREFYGVVLKTALGKIIFLSLVIGLAFWVTLEINRMFFYNTVSSKSARKDIVEFVQKENELIIKGASKEDKSILWGIQLSTSLLLYPFLLIFSTLYRSVAERLALPSKIYILFLMALYAISLIISRFITISLKNVTLFSLRRKPTKIVIATRSIYLSLIKYVAIIMIFFVIFSIFENVNPLNVILSALGFQIRYKDPLSIYALKLNSYESVIESYMKNVEKLLEILIKLFWG